MKTLAILMITLYLTSAAMSLPVLANDSLTAPVKPLDTLRTSDAVNLAPVSPLSTISKIHGALPVTPMTPAELAAVEGKSRSEISFTGLSSLSNTDADLSRHEYTHNIHLTKRIDKSSTK